jgi:hypothetical protein
MCHWRLGACGNSRGSRHVDECKSVAWVAGLRQMRA